MARETTTPAFELTIVGDVDHDALVEWLAELLINLAEDEQERPAKKT